MNQFIAIAEKLSALETEEFFRVRAVRGNREAFLSFLDDAGDESPSEGDQPPTN